MLRAVPLVLSGGEPATAEEPAGRLVLPALPVLPRLRQTEQRTCVALVVYVNLINRSMIIVYPGDYLDLHVCSL